MGSCGDVSSRGCEKGSIIEFGRELGDLGEGSSRQAFISDWMLLRAEVIL